MGNCCSVCCPKDDPKVTPEEPKPPEQKPPEVTPVVEEKPPEEPPQLRHQNSDQLPPEFPVWADKYQVVDGLTEAYRASQSTLPATAAEESGSRAT